MDKKTFDIISNIANEHASVAFRKKFGYLTKDDLVNEIWVICLEAVKTYDSTVGPLENYLRKIAFNRIINRHKNITKSIKSPCPACPFQDIGNEPDCLKFGLNKHLCDKWSKYMLSRDSRNALLNSVEQGMDREEDCRELDKIIGSELVHIVKDKIPKKYFRDFVKLISHEKISKLRFKRISREVKKILHDIDIQKYVDDEQAKNLIDITIEGKEI